MKSPSKKPAKPFVEVKGVYQQRNGNLVTVTDYRPEWPIYPWHSDIQSYTDNGMCWEEKGGPTPFDLIARVSIRIIRRNPHLGGGKE